MIEFEKDLRDYIAILLRRKKLLFWPAAAIFAVAVVVAFVLPPVYRSTATVLIEQPEIPPDLVQSMVTSYADHRLQVIRQRVMTTRNLIEILDKYGLYADERKKQPISTVVEGFRKNVRLNLVSADVRGARRGGSQATIAFTLSFDYRNPRRTPQIVNELVSLYLAENVRVRRKSVEQTLAFLDQEVARLDRIIGETEAKLAEFKRRHAGGLPRQLDSNARLMNITASDLSDTQRGLQVLKEQNIVLHAQLKQISPYSVDGEVASEPADQLRALRREYISISSAYSAEHPDVVRARRRIAALEREVGSAANASGLEGQLKAVAKELADARERYGPKHPDVTKLERAAESLESAIADAPKTNSGPPENAEPDNPPYIQLKIQIQSVASEIQWLEYRRKLLKKSLARYQQLVEATPEIEREYLALRRSYDNAVSKYRELKSKQLAAQISESLEAENKSERFTLLEPPVAPTEPIKPNRPAIMFMGFVLAVASGFGLVAFAEGLDQAVYGEKQLTAITGSRPLVVVPYIENKRDRRRTWITRVFWVVTVVLVGSLALAAVRGYIYKAPLDVYLFKAARMLHVEQVLKQVLEWIEVEKVLEWIERARP